MHSIHFVDSYTGGEPTRAVLAGFFDLGHGALTEQRQRLRDEYDAWRTPITCESPGSSTRVGALLLAAQSEHASAGMIFFNNVGYLGICGHGTVGVDLHDDGDVSVDNMVSYRHAAGLRIDVPGGGVRGDVVWGGNGFFITGNTSLPLEMQRQHELTTYTEAIRHPVKTAGIRGANGAEIDHIEINAASPTPGIDACNFVLCAGLAADGKLAAGQPWMQESILGSAFEARYEPAANGGVLTRITGNTPSTARDTLLIDESHPFTWGCGVQ